MSCLIGLKQKFSNTLTKPMLKTTFCLQVLMLIQGMVNLSALPFLFVCKKIFLWGRGLFYICITLSHFLTTSRSSVLGGISPVFPQAKRIQPNLCWKPWQTSSRLGPKNKRYLLKVSLVILWSVSKTFLWNILSLQKQSCETKQLGLRLQD